MNARPHLGFALELVQADTLARHYRQRGDLVRFQTGTDDNSLKNVLTAQAEGVPVRALVRRNAAVVPGGGYGASADPGAGPLLTACERAPALVGAALDGFDFRAAADAAWHIVDQANRYIEDVRPWYLARTEHDPGAAPRLDAALRVLVHACRCLARELTPFIPATAAQVAAQCTPSVPSGMLPAPEPVFPRLCRSPEIRVHDLARAGDITDLHQSRRAT